MGDQLHDQRHRRPRLGGLRARSGWAGLANLYYWIDRKNGIGGFWATQVFPFADAASFGGYMAFETALYESLRQRQAA